MLLFDFSYQRPKVITLSYGNCTTTIVIGAKSVLFKLYDHGLYNKIQTYEP